MEASERHPVPSDVDWHSFVPVDVASAADWLLAEARFSYLLYFSLFNLGKSATAEDAEEVTQQFLLTSLENVLRCFRAPEGNFWSYFLKSLQHACWRKGKQLRLERRQKQLFREEAELQSEQIRAATIDPLQHDELSASLNLAMQELDARAARALELHHKLDKTVAEVADDIGVSLPNAKVLLHRARHDAAELIRWESCSRLKAREVCNWPSVCRSLIDSGGHATVAGTLWARLNGEARQLVRSCADSEVEISEAEVARLTSEINELLITHDLWPASVIKTFRQQNAGSDHAMHLLRKRHKGTITSLRLNRLILEYGLPEQVAASNPEDTDHEP